MYTSAHVLHYFFLLYIVDNSHFVTFVRTISILMVPFTAPTLNGFTPWPLPTYLIHYMLSKIWLSLRIVSKKWKLVPLLPLFLIKLLLVLPSLLESRLSFLLMIYYFFSSYRFLYSLGVIILDFITNQRWHPTQVPLNLHCLILDEGDILQQL